MAATGSEAVTLKQLKAYDQSKGGFNGATFTELYNSSSGTSASAILSQSKGGFNGATFTELYNSSSGTSASAILSQSIANFKMIAVICRDDKKNVCSTLCYNNGSSSATVAVSTNVYWFPDERLYTTCGVVNLNGTSATLIRSQQGWIGKSNSCDLLGNNGTFVLISVVGIDW